MSGKWRLHGFKGDLISDGFSTLAQATAALERRVGRTLAPSYGGSGGVWSLYVDGHRYWVLEDSSSGFPIGSGLEHRNAKACSECFLVHPTGDCPW
jgi:hypothetical protein